MKKYSKIDKEELTSFIQTVTSLKEVVEKFRSSNRRINKLIKRYSINITHFPLRRNGRPKKLDLVIEAIKTGKSNEEIVKLGICANSNWVSTIRKRFNLQKSPNICFRIDENKLAEIQKYYDNGYSIRDTAKYFNISQSTLRNYTISGKFKSRTLKQAIAISKKPRHKHTQESKDKIRATHIIYMQKNPEKTAWSRRHRHEKSFPEKIFEDELNRRGITGWEYDFQAGIYKYDFAFPNFKLDVEIDGSWHDSEKQMQKDKLRDNFTLMNGWIVLRFKAKEVQTNLIGCVDKLQEFLKLHF